MILFYSKECDGHTAKLVDSEAIHCKQALRKKIGDEVYLTDGLGQCYVGRITNIAKKHVEIDILREHPLSKSRTYKIHIAIAPTKNISRFEWFLEKATEFGVDEITPLLCARSERKIIKPERLEKILVSAMKQSLKARLPKLNPLTSYSNFIQGDCAGSRFIAHLEDQPELLINSYQADHDSIILIGPEGDFTPDEISMGKQAEFASVSLGDYRLRTETAGIAAVQQVHFINQLSTRG